MFSISRLRDLKDPKIAMLGNHVGIVQSVLDFDYLNGRTEHSIVAIVGVQQKTARFFWGKNEILIPCYARIADMPTNIKKEINLFAVAQSGRRALEASTSAIAHFPNVIGGMIFAEGVPEQHALKIRQLSEDNNVFILGPASVGLTMSGVFKLGAIGGTTAQGIEATGLMHTGSAAVISSSGGMVNEIINMVAKHNGRVSFAAAIGGERFPITKPVEVLAEAIADPHTKAVFYFGELGGQDEYEIAEYLKLSKSKKPVVCYIAGVVAEYFDTPPQFGHAKAMAANGLETTSAKKKILKESGAIVADSFLDFEQTIKEFYEKQNQQADATKFVRSSGEIAVRKPALFVNRVSTDSGDEVKILGKSLLENVETNTYTTLVLSMLLGKPAKSKELKQFFDYSMKLLVDHGPQVSGAVNTMITARAGRDLASSLATGILTIGPRFGGAINQAAYNWFYAVENNEKPFDFVERHARTGQYIQGIGHKKYRSDNPDPRVSALVSKFAIKGKYLAFAKEVEKITLSKKSQLILNVDGVIAAIALDILVKKEKLNKQEIELLITSEFFNAIFILARSVGFTAHFMEQKRLDEGLFRLPDDLIFS